MSQRFATSFTQFIPKAVLVILIAQIFSSLSFGLVLATLTPFAMHYLHISQTQAVGLTTSFLGFNFALHLVGGFIGGRFVSYRALFTVGTFLQIIACLFLTNITTSTIYFGLAAFLAGVGLNFPCINCMLLQLFKAEDKRRETAFLWNYSGISLGLLISFILISILQWRHNFSVLFFMSAASNIIVLLVIIGNWKKLADRTTLLMTFNKDTLIASFLKSILFILIIFSALFYLLQNINDGHHILILLSIIMFFLFIYFIFRQPTLQSRKRLLSCFIFAIVTVGFWTLYMSTPVLLPFFTTQAVNPRLFGLPIPLPWFSNISMLVIFIGGFLLSLLFQGVRKKGYPFTLPIQFTIALFLLFLAFVAIPIGIKMTPVNSLVAPGWLVLNYVLQGIALLFIQPIGYAMIGQLVPVPLQGLMMGTWLMLSGIGAAIAMFLKNYLLAIPTGNDINLSKYFYINYFNKLAWAAFAMGIVLLLLMPFLTKSIHYRSLDPTHN